MTNIKHRGNIKVTDGDITINGNPIVKSIKRIITEVEILDVSGFLIELVDNDPNKILIPLSIIACRKEVGTSYSISNSVVLATSGGNGSSTLNSIGNLDGVFTNSAVGCLSRNGSISNYNTNLVPNNTIYLASSGVTNPSTITGGTGDIIVTLNYVEISVD